MSTEPEKDGLEWEVASGGQRWPPSVGQEPSQHWGQEAHILDRATPKHSFFFRDYWLFSWKNCTFLSQVFRVWAGRICRKSCIPNPERLTWCSPPVREFTFNNNRRVQVIALRDDGRKYLFHSDPVLVHLPFSQQGSSYCKSYGTLWNSSLLPDKRRLSRLALPHKRSSSIFL